ncbi:hypothetical protein [Marilutibacter aestuarii]|uniref:Uncharacterized protein n=1 Tax=Marilutibacter aestuarii TaxID=1706195 RepID=A0A508ARY2_9GAMM|nr:hypothetical protein [Lysobacter aestuarii]TQD51224.1 hypothetical protein FKV25_01975 [Lysobacter aestuarii]
MSVSHCMGKALEIAAGPLDTWAGKIAALPDACLHSDCGAPRNCRERIADYLRVQYRAAKRKAAMPPRKGPR